MLHLHLTSFDSGKDPVRRQATSLVMAAAVLLALCVQDGLCAQNKGGPDFAGGSAAYADGLLSIKAQNVRPEDLMREIGEKCNIKVVVFGEVFSEVPISLQFQNSPLVKGIKRVLRVAQITNYLLHSEDTTKGPRVIEIDLVGEKGGERHLTAGAARQSRPARRAPPARQRATQPARDFKTNIPEEDAERIQESFLTIMDEVLKAQLEEGAEPDPAQILKLFNEVVPPEMKDQIPPEVLEELERMQ